MSDQDERIALCDEIIQILLQAERSEFPFGDYILEASLGWEYARIYVERAKSPEYLGILTNINDVRGLPSVKKP